MSCGCQASNGPDLRHNPAAGTTSSEASSPGLPASRPAALIDGFSHMIFTVSSWDESKRFYHKMCSHMGLTCVLDTADWLYYVGGERLKHVTCHALNAASSSVSVCSWDWTGRTAIGLRPCSSENAGRRFDQGRAGLHHACMRVRSRQAVEDMHRYSLLLPLHELCAPT
jgi:catechol 2,3-dioxygenase-like lactoylglutathione lyase family enzyme